MCACVHGGRGGGGLCKINVLLSLAPCSPVYTLKSEYNSSYLTRQKLKDCFIAYDPVDGKDLHAKLSFSDTCHMYSSCIEFGARTLLASPLSCAYIEQVPCDEANSSATKDKASLACRSPEKLV